MSFFQLSPSETEALRLSLWVSGWALAGSLPVGIVTGTILAFARSLGELGATITFVSNIRGETQTLPLALYTLTQMPDGEIGALRLCVISIVLAMAALVGSDWLDRRFAAYIKG